MAFINSCINSIYNVGFYCNWAGLEIHEEQLDIARRLARPSNPQVDMWNAHESSNFRYNRVTCK